MNQSMSGTTPPAVDGGHERIFLVNVGVNASHRVRSPLFDDGTFELMPIPEKRELWAPTLPAYGRIPCFNDPDESLAAFASDHFRGVRVHDDPEFRTFTYGDNPNRSPRAAGLKACGPGDYLFFIARLTPFREGKYAAEAGFYLVGFLHVQRVLTDVTVFPVMEDFQLFGANAHVRRAVYHRRSLDGFWVWKGATESSQRFRIAVPVDRTLCELTLRDAHGKQWRWGDGRTELQTIGSYTRSARLVIDATSPAEPERAEAWWSAVRARNPEIVIG